MEPGGGENSRKRGTHVPNKGRGVPLEMRPRRKDRAPNPSAGGKGRSSTLARLRWVISRVPRGKVITYGQVASAGGFPGAARLTVRALQKGEGLPWHRVVAAGGRIALPGEPGREQRLRLQVEGVRFRRDRVRMDLHNWTPSPSTGRRVLVKRGGSIPTPSKRGPSLGRRSILDFRKSRPARARSRPPRWPIDWARASARAALDT
jgi:methylated-DNA-protein-cysteine methyltransferase related protein